MSCPDRSPLYLSRDLTFVSAVLALLSTAAAFLINHYESEENPSNSSSKREPEPELIRHLMDMFCHPKGDHIRLKQDPLSEDEVLH